MKDTEIIGAALAAAAGALISYLSDPAGRRSPGSASFSAAISAGYWLPLCLRHGVTRTAVSGMALMLVLLSASKQDLRERKAEDSYWLMIILIGVGCGTLRTFAAGAAVLVTGVIIACMMPGRIGGADVKCPAACFTVLGIRAGLAGLAAGLMSGILFALVKAAVKKSGTEPIPLIPFLSAGFLAAYLI